MICDTLNVLHIKRYNNKSDEFNPLAEFREVVKPFAPMTCARHVYIYFDSKGFDLKSKLPEIKEKSGVFEHMTGVKAYEFLLRWFVGAESSKLNGSDHFVLGQVRKPWTEYCQEKKVEPLMNSTISRLFQDARNIRQRIQEYDIKSEAKRTTLRRMCKNCVQYRVEGFEPVYDDLIKGSEAFLQSAQEVLFAERLKNLSKTMQILNLKAGEDNLSPSDVSTHSKGKYVGMFRRNISLALEKRTIREGQKMKSFGVGRQGTKV